MKKKKILVRAVLTSLLALSCQPAVWATEGVDMPFSTPSVLAGEGGTAFITSSNVNHLTKGIYASGHDFTYDSGPINLDITGFAHPSENIAKRSIGIYAYNGTIDLPKIELNFIATPEIVNEMEVYGVQTYATGVVKLGDDSKITVSGNVSGPIPSSGADAIMTGMYAGDNATEDSGKIEVGNNFVMKVQNTGNAETYGILSFDRASITAGNNMQLDVAGQNSTIGVMSELNSTVALGKDASVTVKSTNGQAMGVYALNNGLFTADSGLVVDAKNEDASVAAYGIAVFYDSEAELNGADIIAQQGTELGYAIRAYDDSRVVGKEGRYNIYGNILNQSGSLVDITANNASLIKGWVRTYPAAVPASIAVAAAQIDTETNISLADNSLWIMKGNSNLTNLVNDNSVIDMTQNGKVFNTLKVANLTGSNDGLIKMNIDASRSSDNSDMLYVTDTLSGTQYIDLYEINDYTPVGDEGVGTVLATVNNNDGTLLAKDGEGTIVLETL